MANLQTSVTWAEYADRIREYVGACGVDEDTTLQEMLNVAVVWGDSYTENPFTDADSVDIPIPLGVLNGVWAFIKIEYDAFISSIPPGVSGVKTRDLSQNWAGPSGFSLDDSVYMAVCNKWYPYRINVWR